MTERAAPASSLEIKSLTGSSLNGAHSGNGNGNNGVPHEAPVYKPRLSENAGIRTNVLASMGQMVLDHYDSRLDWEKEFNYWIGKLRETEPPIADAYIRRYQNQRSSIFYYRID